MGEKKDFQEAIDVFVTEWLQNPVSYRGKKAACVLTRLFRLENRPSELFKYALRDMMEAPCAEICYELGCYYENCNDYDEALVWYLNARYETECIIDVCCGGNLPLEGIVRCYEHLLTLDTDYTSLLEKYRTELAEGEMPEEL